MSQLVSAEESYAMMIFLVCYVFSRWFVTMATENKMSCTLVRSYNDKGIIPNVIGVTSLDKTCSLLTGN